MRIPPERVAAYERMRVWHESVAPLSRDVLEFAAADIGEPNLGCILEGRALQAALLDSFVESGGIIEPVELHSLHIGVEAVEVETSNGRWSARLVVGADGAQSRVRASIGIAVEEHDYRQTAIVATVTTERGHGGTAWQRFLSNGTLALLPLADGTSSIVWSADEPRATELLKCSAGDFERELDGASDLVLGRTRLLGERGAFGLRRLAAQHYVAQRCALVGDAAHVVHPLAGQGVNLGLLDAAVLAQLIDEARSRREDPGALGVLRRYERWRRSDVAVMSTAIDAFDRLLAHGRGLFARAAQTGLGVVNRTQEMKRFFARRALGLSGELPRVAR